MKNGSGVILKIFIGKENQENDGKLTTHKTNMIMDSQIVQYGRVARRDHGKEY